MMEEEEIKTNVERIIELLEKVEHKTRTETLWEVDKIIMKHTWYSAGSFPHIEKKGFVKDLNKLKHKRG